jgi:carbon-monoxide dehydrogenase medium subunit
MKPPPFDYLAPASIDEALTELTHGGSDAKLLAGGQSLIPLLNFRLAQPSLLIDLNRIPALAYIAPSPDGVALGAMTRQATVERDHALASVQPLLTEAIGWVGHPAIRSRGTLGGSLAHADPAAELPAVAVCLGAELTLRSPRGQRAVTAEQFYTGYLTSVLEPDELLIEIWLPSLPPRTGQAWVEFARRHGDFALVGVAVSLTLDPDLRIEAARVVLAGVGGTPERSLEAEAALPGGQAERAVAAARAAGASITPPADLHASSAYRARLAQVLTERAIGLAYERAVLAAPAALDIGRMLDARGRRA